MVFEQRLEQLIALTRIVSPESALRSNLRLRIDSDSNKFSLYPRIREILTPIRAGLRIKTAGTTWLEKTVGLAGAGGVRGNSWPTLIARPGIHSPSLSRPTLR